MTDEAIEFLWENGEGAEVHIRDKWQFSFKSEFLPHEEGAACTYTQEFYLFIPSSLQINQNTYTKNDFYLDETNLIRYKTPEFTFFELRDEKNERSPLNRIRQLLEGEETVEEGVHLSDELKLYANIFRSTLRKEVKHLIALIKADKIKEERQLKYASPINQLIKTFSEHIIELQEIYDEIELNYFKTWKLILFHQQMLYIKEFITDSIYFYLTNLLECIRLSIGDRYKESDERLCNLLLKNNTSTKEAYVKALDKESRENEGLLYRFGLLNKFVLESLLLFTSRFSLEQHYQERYQHWISGLSAGLAMLLYFSLFVWLGNVFLINSIPFLMLMVFVYILKDRMKEGLRVYSYIQASRWFPDYTTIIMSQDNKIKIGEIKESFSFINPLQLSSDIKEMRNIVFQNILEGYQRSENIIFYKRIVSLNKLVFSKARRHTLNIIFRFNIHRFLYKAADPFEIHLILDPLTKKLGSLSLPKVYHLNLIIKNTCLKPKDSQSPLISFQKLRLIIDKNGIKRIEQI